MPPPKPRAHRLFGEVSVSLEKPLGLLLEEEDDGCVVVKEVREGGSAFGCPDVSEGSQVVMAAGLDCRGLGLDEVMEAIGAASSPVDLRLATNTCLIKIIDDGESTFVSAKTGDNLRKALLQAGAKIYDFRGTLTNCNGGGQCGTCVVALDDAPAFTPRSDWEAGKLKGRSENHRLSCQVLVAGDQATVTLRPPKK